MPSQTRDHDRLDERRPLITAALLALDRAYAPYSRFRVGAAVRAADGTIVAGANVENASYGLTMCAERVAVYTAVAAGHRQITDVVVATDASPPSSPCGACRQVLREFGPSLHVIGVNPSGERWETTLSDLLPRSFGPEDLAGCDSTHGTGRGGAC